MTPGIRDAEESAERLLDKSKREWENDRLKEIQRENQQKTSDKLSRRARVLVAVSDRWRDSVT